MELSTLIIAVNAAVLILGGVSDLRRREIPNYVPVCLMLTGIAAGDSLLYRFVCMLMTAFILWLTAKLTQCIPGGDFKLITAMAFSSGLAWTLLALCIVGVMCCIIKLIRREPMRTIPLCTYMTAAYFIAGIIFFQNPIYFSGLLIVYMVFLVYEQRKNKPQEETDEK